MSGLDVAAGTLAFIELSFSAGKFVTEVYEVAKDIDVEFASLRSEVVNFRNGLDSLRQLQETTKQRPYRLLNTSGVDDPSPRLWNSVKTLTKEGTTVVERLEEQLREALGDGTTLKKKKIVDIQKALKLLRKKDEFNRLRLRFTNINSGLSVALNALTLHNIHSQHLATIEASGSLPINSQRDAQQLITRLKKETRALEDSQANVGDLIIPARNAVIITSLNRHFYIRSPETAIWTGRKALLSKIEDAFLAQNTSAQMQKRFVVHGIAGAGKTQLCSKFAQDFRDSFWGIFEVDATHQQSAAESWKAIAKIGGKDANMEAGKFWLSNLESPWLLIIDSADGSEDFLNSHLPTGNRGCILITTRNPKLEVHANVGNLALEKLDAGEASELLRKASRHLPWDDFARQSASSIAKHLEYLPLALVHAGRAIFHKVCTLSGYIPFFNRTLDALQTRFHARNADLDGDYDPESLGAFTSFDIIYLGLEARARATSIESRVTQDAMELLNIFSFLHSSDIRLDIITRAGCNLRAAASPPNPTASEEATSTSPLSNTLSQRLKSFLIAQYIKFVRPAPALPHLLSGLSSRPFSERRVRKAIDLLVTLSLLTESSEEGHYSMHPLVHLWIRKRLSTSAQALWCGSARDVLASSIKIPPLQDEPGDQEFYVRLLAHVEHVQAREEEIKEQLCLNCRAAGMWRQFFWMDDPKNFNALDAIDAAKISRVYMECSSFPKAEQLQRRVRNFVESYLGPQTVVLVPISLALSTSLWHQGRPTESQQLQENALQICQAQLGPTDAQTLKVMDALGETYWQRGMLKEAKALHEKAIEGMSTKPALKREMLIAIVHLAHVHEWYTEFEKALDLLDTATFELENAYGEADSDTMIAKDSLAMVLLQQGGLEQIQRAEMLMQDIYRRRRERLGEEHLYTLWAMCNYSRTLSARGVLEQDDSLIMKAKEQFDDGIEIVTRNLGPDHLGTLMGRTFRANTLVALKDYAAAESEFLTIAEKQKTTPGAREGSHRDRLMTFKMLAACYEEEHKFAKALNLYDVIVDELDGLGGQQHPWRSQIVAKREAIRSRMRLRS